MGRFSIWTLTLLLAFSIPVKSQSNKITGVVYKNDRAQLPFETPAGKITLYLPDDMAAGDIISGTVVSEPEGKNEKEKAKNLAELKKYVLTLPGGKQIELQPGTASNGQIISITKPFTIKSVSGNSMPVTINTPGNKSLATANIVLLPDIPPGTIANEFTLSRKLISNDETLVLLHSISEAPRVILNNYFSNAPSQSYILTALTHSPGKSVFTIPKNISGLFTVCVATEGKTQLIDLVNIVGLDATIGKGNLLRGEKTEMSITVSGLEGCPYRPVELEIINNTPSVVRLENGDRQIFPVHQPELLPGQSLYRPYNTTQIVIGNSTGAFEINTILHYPAASYTNPVEPYLEQIITPEAFNKAMSALKSDLGEFISRHADLEKSSLNYLQRSMGSLPNIGAEKDLNWAKSYAKNIISPISGLTENKLTLAALDKLYPLSEQAAIPQLVHPLHDLAGEFDPSTNILTVQKENEEALLQYLGAASNGDGSYNFELSGENGQLMQFTKVKPQRPRSIFDHLDRSKACGPGQVAPRPAEPVQPGQPPKSSQPSKPAQPAKPDGPPQHTPKDNLGTKAQTDETPPPKAGDIPQTPEAPKDTTKKEESSLPKPTTVFTDSTGRKYRFYKDAECQELLGENKIDCRPREDRVFDPESKTFKDVPTDQFERWDMLAMRICVRGKGFCTEMWQITSVQMIFEDKDCKRLVKVINWEGFSCQ